MSNEQREEIEKNILNLENQFRTKLIGTGRMRNVGMVNRMSLIAAELLSNEEISESIYALMQNGVGIEFSCNEMLRDNLKEKSERYTSGVYAHVYTFTGDNSITSTQWERVAVPVPAERMYRNYDDLADEGNNLHNNEIYIQGEFKDEALIQDYYSGIVSELTFRDDVITQEADDGSINLTLPNGVAMEFEAYGDDEGRGLKKAWKKVKTLVEENKPGVVGALVFATGGLLAYYGSSIPFIGSTLAAFSVACVMYSGVEMMKDNEYYIGCKYKQKF